ncbi:hypothetical protein [Xanthocytophaga agilis]|uniref:Uncharacterized protein n=1 Tax=Xanthocytophaga agilis TaxID=3048010 RepID=A0AAE3RE86_9BACT|nr:hypothetical protein [Xanthocytophaga agilis]MDJ1506288.1 hypothetical protein [Xanthocytophaga agilis]
MMDVGKRIYYAGELISKILKDVFYLTTESDLQLDLFDDGVLPYEKMQIE